MNYSVILFYVFSFFCILGASGLILTKNLFYGALYLLTCLLGLAGIYVLLFAEYIAVIQILIYAGGIIVIILFGIMLTHRDREKPVAIKTHNMVTGVFTGLLVMSLLVSAFHNFTPSIQKTFTLTDSNENIRRIGINLMTEDLLPFEMAGVLLLMALIGAAIIASYKQEER